MSITDRQRVEIVLPAQIMLGILLAGVSEETPEFEACKLHLLNACKEPVADLLPRQQSKILDRATRLHRDVARPYVVDGADTAKFGLVVFYWLQSIVDCGYFAFTDGSAIDKALKLFLPAIEHAAQVEAIDRSAQKQARKFLGRLQSLGYFQGVPA